MEHISLNLRGIRAEELSFKQNNVKIPKDAKLDLKPSFSRRVRKTPDNEKLHFVTLEVKIESSETSPQALRSESLPDGRIRGGSRKRLRTARVQRAGGRDPVSLSQGGGHQSHGRGVRRAARSARGGRRALSRGQGTARSLSELIFTSATQSEKWVKKAGGLLIV